MTEPTPLAVGDEIELEITGIAHGGVTVARHEGRVVFVADAIPGERVVARVSDDRKSSFWRAETVEVLEASPDRVEHIWREAAIDREPGTRAGGAEFGHIALPRQRALKTEVLIDSLRRFGKIERDVTGRRGVGLEAARQPLDHHAKRQRAVG